MLGWVSSKPWIWAWMIAELVSLLALLRPHHQGELSDTAPASSSSATAGKGSGQVSCSHAIGADIPAPTALGPALLCCPSEVLLLFLVLQMVRRRASCPAIKTPGPTLLPAAGGEVGLSFATKLQRRDPMFMPLAHLCTPLLPLGPALLCYPDKVASQFSPVMQLQWPIL